MYGRLFRAGFYSVVVLCGALALGSGMASAQDDPNRFSSFTGVASGLFVQSLELTRHFVVENPESSASMLNDDQKLALGLEQGRYQILPITWSLGVGYGSSYSGGSSLATSANPALTDQMWFGTGALHGEIGQDWSWGARLNYDQISSESYQHGMLLLNAAYEFPVSALAFWKTWQENEDDDSENVLDEETASTDSRDYDLDDARQYYQYQRRMQAVGRSAKEQPFIPKLQIQYVLGFDLYQASGANATGTPLYGYMQGPLLSYLPNARWKFNFGAYLYRYTSSVDSFVSNIQGAATFRESILSWGGWSGFANNTLVLASSILTTSATYVWDDKNTTELRFNRVAYATSGVNPTYGISPFYQRKFGERWSGNISAQVTLGAPMGSTGSLVVAGALGAELRI